MPAFMGPGTLYDCIANSTMLGPSFIKHVSVKNLISIDKFCLAEIGFEQKVHEVNIVVTHRKLLSSNFLFNSFMKLGPAVVIAYIKTKLGNRVLQ